MTGAGEPGTGEPGGVVSVRRTGGFMGLSTEGSLDLASDDPRADEVRRLVAEVDPGAVRPGGPHPDMYTYDFDLAGTQVTVAEHLLPPGLRRVAELVLPDRTR